MANGFGVEVPGMNSIRDMMKNYSESIKNSTNLNSMEGFDAPLQGSAVITKLDFNDKELVNDLEKLTGKNYADNVHRTNELSSDTTVEGVADAFSRQLKSFVGEVNESQRGAESAMETFASGGNIDLHSVMIAAEKSSLNMQLTMQLRNKIVQAYQEVSRMSV